MKSLVLQFEDAEFASLKRAKGQQTWREFILSKKEGAAVPAAPTAPDAPPTTAKESS